MYGEPFSDLQKAVGHSWHSMQQQGPIAMYYIVTVLFFMH